MVIFNFRPQKSGAAMPAPDFHIFFKIGIYLLIVFQSKDLCSQFSPIRLDTTVEFFVNKKDLTGFESKSTQFICNNGKIWFSLGLKHSTKVTKIVEINLENYNLKVIEFAFPRKKKLDSRVRNGGLFVSSAGELHAYYWDVLCRLNQNDNILEIASDLKHDLNYVISDNMANYGFVNYSYSSGQEFKAIKFTDDLKKAEKVLKLNSSQAEFFNFGKSKLWAIGANFLVQINVAEPFIHLYDKNLNKLRTDTLKVECWRSTAVIDQISTSEKVILADKYSRAMDYFEKGLTKVLDISKVAIDTFQVVFTNGMDGYYLVFFRLDDGGEVTGLSECFLLDKKMQLMNNSWYVDDSKIYRIEFTNNTNGEGDMLVKLHKYIIEIPPFE
jgi:hypothetical protein